MHRFSSCKSNMQILTGSSLEIVNCNKYHLVADHCAWLAALYAAWVAAPAVCWPAFPAAVTLPLEPCLQSAELLAVACRRPAAQRLHKWRHVTFWSAVKSENSV